MTSRRSSRIVSLARVARALGRRPNLWPTAIGLARSHAMRGWWKQWPFIPRPAGAYVAFRLETQYGDVRLARDPQHDEHRPRPGTPRLTDAEPDDVLKYLAWVREWNQQR